MPNRPTSNRARRPQPIRHQSRLRRFVLYTQIGLLLMFGIGIGGAVGTFMTVSGYLQNVSGYVPPEATKIYSSDNVLLATFGQENRELVDLKDIPSDLQVATVAIEDKRFYEHPGVDLRGILRAVKVNITGGKLSQGGSTITQQLARNVFLSQERTARRKAQELALAVLIERNYTKPKILELYLNQVYYGSGAFGVQAAAKIYFGKDVDKLNLAECAMIAGLPQSPSSKSPHVNLRAAIERRDKVLDKMEEAGKITPEQRDRAKQERPHIVPLRPTRFRSRAPYFTDYVRTYLREYYQLGDDQIFRGGLRVYTTANFKMQEKAQDAIAKGVARYKREGTMSRTQGNAALVCIEPETGYIRALVGGADYADPHAGQWNRATQGPGRQPGSSFKIFDYTAAVDLLGWDVPRSRL